MGGLEIVNKDREGKIKQDLKVSRSITSGKIIEINKLKELEEKELAEKESIEDIK
jgi:hypothetical protein